MKALKAIVLILLIVILIPVAASCAGVSLLAIGGGAIVYDVLEVDPTNPAVTAAPAPTIDARLAPTERVILDRYDQASEAALTACRETAGGDVDASSRCDDRQSFRDDVRGMIIECFDRSATLDELYYCEDLHPIEP